MEKIAPKQEAKVKSATQKEAMVKEATFDWSAYDKKPYTPTSPETVEELGFEAQPMVGWFSPKELGKAGVEAAISSVFGTYADKREIESVLSRGEWQDYSGDFADNGDELWIDYVADLGDGWDATYTVARLLAEEELHFSRSTLKNAPAGDGATPTHRGRLLIMGGDEVYPTASKEEYNQRMIKPYECALPSSDYQTAPHLYLVPGNHDWYDGLTNFYNLFCRKRWVGGWKTWQRRSYFALKIHDKLWLWGIDIQLKSDIDEPQYDYFGYVAKEVMEEGSKIILCTAEPTWVFVETETKYVNGEQKKKREKTKIYNNLGVLEKYAVAPYKHEVVVGLAGDWHTYTRYEAEDGKQRFVSGGGGAYLYPTHNMPQTLNLPNKDKPYERKGVFPNEKESKKLAFWSIGFPFFPHNRALALVIGVFYLVLSWILQSASKGMGDVSMLDAMKTSLFEWGNFETFYHVLRHSPASVVLLAILVGGLAVFPAAKKWLGFIHGLIHVGLLVVLMSVFAWLNLGIMNLDVDSFFQAVLFSLEMALVGGLASGMVFGAYFCFTNLFFKIHDNEVLLCQSDPDFKNFLRFHITKDKLTIYPIGIRRVNRMSGWKHRGFDAWTYKSKVKGNTPWFEPKQGTIEDLTELIEEPITVNL